MCECVCLTQQLSRYEPTVFIVEAHSCTRPTKFQNDKSQVITIDSSDLQSIQTHEADGKCSVRETCTVCLTHVQNTRDLCARPTRHLARDANCVYDPKVLRFSAHNLNKCI